MLYSSMNTDRILRVRMTMENKYESSSLYYAVTSTLFFVLAVLIIVTIGLVQKDR